MKIKTFFLGGGGRGGGFGNKTWYCNQKVPYKVVVSDAVKLTEVAFTRPYLSV